MAGKKKQDKDTGWISDIENYSRQIWLAGLGAYAKVGKEGVKLFDTLIKDGEQAEKAAKAEIDKQVEVVKGKANKGKKDSVDSAKAKVDKARGKVSGRWDELEAAFDKRLNSAVSRLGVPSRDEVKALNAKVDELAVLITQMNTAKKAGKVAPKAAPRAAAKAAAPKPAAAAPKPAAPKPVATKPAAKSAPASAQVKATAKAAAKPKAAPKPKAPAKPKAATGSRTAAKPQAAPGKAAAPAPAAPAAATPAQSADKPANS